jgi:signal transduction histidine kinase/sensor domain CHASE-containing protein
MEKKINHQIPSFHTSLKKWLMSKTLVPSMAALLLFFIGCTLSYRLSFMQHSANVNRERDRTVIAVEHVRNNLSRELYAALNLTEGIAALVRMQNGIGIEQFDAMTGLLISHNPLIRNVALAKGYIIQYVYPLNNNQKALGLDYRNAPDQIPAVERCIKERLTVIAGPVELVQGGIGIVGRTPIFLADSLHSKSNTDFWGIASTVINFDMLLKSSGYDSLIQKFDIALRGVDGTGSNGAVFVGDQSVFEQSPVLLDIPLPSGSWQMGAIPLNGWSPFNPFSSLAFLSGTLISMFFSFLILQTLRTNHKLTKEISLRQSFSIDLEKKNRALRLFSECTSAVVHSTDETALLKKVCTIAVESTEYRMAWIGRAENDEEKRVVPVTFAGPGEGFLDIIKVTWGDDSHGQGTAGISIRTRKPYIARDLLNNPTFSVWRHALVQRDFAAAISIPLIIDNDVYGVLLIYAGEPDAFDSTEVKLLEDLGSNISNGMKALRAEKAREIAMLELERSRSELEIRVAQRTHELLLAKEAAESADRLKSAFLATMSHELRTPLNSIIGFTGIILQGMAGPLNDEQRKQLSMVRDSSHHLLALINDVLDISKIEAGQMTLHQEVFNLIDIIEHTIKIIRPSVEKKSLKLTVHSSIEKLFIKSDPRRVEQIIMNFLSNAVKFTDHGSITLSIETVFADIDANLQHNPPQVKISVTDTGIGIENKNIPLLFAPFKQLDSGTMRRYEGTGLGLSICRKLATLLEGSVSVTSEGLGCGSIFTFSLPITEEQRG